MIAQSLTIARNAFVESLRQPAMLFLVIGSGVVQVLIPWMTGFAMGQEESGELEGDNKLQFDIGLSSVFVIATILAAFIATTTLSREIENKTALTVVSKPIGRPTVVVGKYLGVSAALLIALGSMIIFLLVSVRHGVLSNASDQLDMPAIVFPLAAVLISLVASGFPCSFRCSSWRSDWSWRSTRRGRARSGSTTSSRR
jgi:ABC-type transport system involved in multi-copper enzyme maturation permease subunit